MIYFTILLIIWHFSHKDGPDDVDDEGGRNAEDCGFRNYHVQLIYFVIFVRIHHFKLDF